MTKVDGSTDTFDQAAVTITLNGATVSSPSFYAPTGAGTNGYVLKSNGSGAPTWLAPSSLSVGSATKATQDASGNTITSKYVAVDTTQTISGAKTFSKTITLSTENYITVSGKAFIFAKSSDFDYSTLTPDDTSGGDNYLKAVLAAACSKYPGKTNASFYGELKPNSQGPMYGHVYSTSVIDSTSKLP